MQTATFDPLADVSPLVQMVLAAEARLSPHILHPPAGEADDVPHLNRVTLILGRLIALRKALRSLRDGKLPARRPASPPPADDTLHTTLDSIAADLVVTNAMLDTFPAAEPAELPATRHATHHPPIDDPIPSEPINNDPPQDLNDSPAEFTPPDSIPSKPAPAPRVLAITPLSPAQSEANAEKLTRAVHCLAAQARRVLPAASPPQLFGFDDIAIQAGPIKLSPALLNNLPPPPPTDST